MGKRIFILLSFSFCLLTGWAQNTVESIRERYTNAKSHIEQNKGDNQYDGSDWAEYYHLEARQFLPGTGGHREDVYLYWNEKEEDKIYNGHWLSFATKRYNYAARNFYEEYLYDADGQVAFIYGYSPMETLEGETESAEYEFRFYLNKGTLLKAIIKRRSDVQEQFVDTYVGNKLGTAYKDFYNEYLKQAKQVRQMFIDIEKETYNYEE